MRNFASLIALCAILLQALAVDSRYHQGYERSVCKNLHGVLVPKRGSCTEFFVCVRGKAIPQTCGPDYHFNRHTHVCDVPVKAGCISYGPYPYPYPVPELDPEYTHNDRPIIDLWPVVPPVVQQPQPQPPTIYIPKPQNPTEVMPDPAARWHCIGRENGILLPTDDSCSHFYVCIRQNTYRRTCPIGMHFNVKKMLCQDAALAGCVAPVIPDNNTNDDDDLETSPLCEYVADGVFLPYAGDCNKYIACSHKRAIQMSCPNELHFSVSHRRCEWPQVAECYYAVEPAKN